MQTLGSVNMICNVFEERVWWLHAGVIMLCICLCIFLRGGPGIYCASCTQITAFLPCRQLYLKPFNWVANYCATSKLLLGEGWYYMLNLLSLPRNFVRLAFKRSFMALLGVSHALKLICFRVLVILTWINYKKFYRGSSVGFSLIYVILTPSQ